jgi:hypothetical protein
MFFLYYFFYGTSFAKVPWVYNSEINSLAWRTRGAAAATATNWMGGFIVTQFTKVGVNNLHWRFYLSMHPPLSKLFDLLSIGSMLIRGQCLRLLYGFISPLCIACIPRHRNGR